MNKNIFIILPFKESLNPSYAGAVSIYVKDTTKLSKFKNKIKIISSDDLDKSKLFRNKNYIINFCKKYKDYKIDIIEIHNRPEYLFYIKKYFPNTKIILIFHNDPLSLRGSIKNNERKDIVSNCHKIVFISKWIQQRFFSSVKNVNLSSTSIIPHGISKKNNINLLKKKKNILFVAKLNEAKGYHIFCEAASKFKKFDPSWNFIAIGNEARKNIFPDPKVVNEIGYKKNSEVLKYYGQSEIAIGNSVWNEPLGRLAIEASSRKCLPIISNSAGLEESKQIAIVLKKNNSTELFNLLKKITSNKTYRRNKQKIFFKRNNFDLKKISSMLDTARANILSPKSKIVDDTQKRVLHIANFNESSDGRLYYSFANKLNNGFIKNNHVVQTISDRTFLKSNKLLYGLFNPIKRLNEKIINTIKNFSPHIIVIGHVFNIDISVFKYCNENNIKIISWYIDSISPEFLNKKSRINFFKNLEFVDYCFLTSSPKIFKSHRFYKKLKFIPNPVDSAIDSFKNFNKQNLKHDIFVAISHGQNRGILKKGKTDEREKLIRDLIFDLPEVKFASFGIDKFEPVWGANYYYYLSNSKMSLNVSRGSYQKLYSSDRISSLIGNGLLVFINKNTEFKKLFTNNEVVYYGDKKDLANKIKYFLLNDKTRIKFAKSAYYKYHKHMNNKIVTSYMINCVSHKNFKKPFWDNLN